MKLKFLFLLSLLLVFSTFPSAILQLKAQRYNNIWYFGRNAGLDFNSGAPVPLTDSKMVSDEGSASIADADGKLLFYTDGITIWNKQHQIMENGADLHGESSTTQAAIIVPAPGKRNLYYVFSQDSQGGPKGLSYSVVDLTKQNGLGAVVEKNIQLHTPTTEMMAAALHENGRDVWLMAHEYGSNKFLAYKVTSAGVNVNPVVSAVGPEHILEAQGVNAIGCMKISLSGRKLAVAAFFTVDLYDFDPATGTVSNQLHINTINAGYGVEFSPDETKLYVTDRASFYINQFDLTAGSAQDIALSITRLQPLPPAVYALQLGPDNKIYCASYSALRLGVIENPNALGVACSYKPASVDLDSKSSTLGLPSYVQSFFRSPTNSISATNLCFGEETIFTFNGSYGGPTPTSTLWNFGDPASGTANTSIETSPSHRFSALGTYTVTLTQTFGNTIENYTITVTVLPLPTVSLGSDRSICPGTTTILDATHVSATAYRWSTGSTQPTLTVAQPGTYWVDVSNAQGCTYRDSVVVSFYALPPINFGPDREVCEGETVVLDATASGTTYRWHDGSTGPTFTATTTGLYEVTMTTPEGCSFKEGVHLTFKPTPVADLGPDRSACQGQPVVLNQFQNGATYRWQDGSTNPIFTATTSGTYWVEITLNGCVARDEVVLTFNPLPTVNLGQDQLVCAGETVVLEATLPNATYRWQDGSTNPTFTVTSPGRYEVTVTNQFGCSATDAITITYKPLPTVDLGPNLAVCMGTSVTLGKTIENATYLWQDGSTAATFSPTVSGTYWQEVTVNGCTARDEVQVTFNPLPTVSLGNDTTLCDTETLLLDVFRTNATYKWQDGSTAPTFMVEQAGEYWVEVTNEFNCTTRDEVRVHYLTPPAIELGNDTTLCFGDSLVVGQILPGVTYVWQDGSTSPTYTIKKPGIYRLTASLQHCGQTDAITIHFKDCVGGLFIPNIITPNGDGLNDVLFIMGLPSLTEPLGESWELTIYDRWGKSIYRNKQYQNEWDAKGVSEGIYFYQLRNNQNGRLLKGWVEVVR